MKITLMHPGVKSEPISLKLPKDFDVHINVVGGGNIDGPSAGVAITLALYSSIENLPIPQDIAVTGEISIQGMVRPVGGIVEKLYGARQAGVKRVYLPKENEKEVPSDLTGIEVVCIENIDEIIAEVFGPNKN